MADPAPRRRGKISFYLNEGAAYRRERDIVLVDQRGSGHSQPLHCPEISASDDPNAPMYGVGMVARCRDALAPSADVSQYTTDASARDLQRVRRALGHARIDIVAASYGTTLAMHYMSFEPDHVRSAVLIAAAPWSAFVPQYHATAANRALRLVMTQCAADAACHAAYPDLDGDLARALARLAFTEASPLPEIFMEDLRRTMYSPSGERRVPAIIHRTAEQGLPAHTPSTQPPAPPTFAEGLYLSITCTESFPLMPYEEAAAASRATPFGDYRLRYQRAACRDWPARTADWPTPDAARVTAPVLFISGYLDPVTPPEWAERAARDYPNPRQIVIPAAAHTNGGLSAIDTCFDAMLVRFYESLDLAGLDASCVAEMRPPPFALN